ncbi:hypothetical protein QF019_005951 [Pseudomonas frederiksbergensis]
MALSVLVGMIGQLQQMGFDQQHRWPLGRGLSRGRREMTLSAGVEADDAIAGSPRTLDIQSLYAAPLPKHFMHDVCPSDSTAAPPQKSL